MSERSNKSSLRHATNVQRQRIELDDDYEVVQSRTESLRGPGGLPKETARSPLKGRTTWTVGDSWAPEDDDEFDLDPDSRFYDEEMEDGLVKALPSEEGASIPHPSSKKKRSQISARPNVFWKNNHRDAYLDEMLRYDGRGDFMHDKVCPDCLARKEVSPGAPLYRCRECFTPDLTCARCCSRRHARLPFHRIERWDGKMFEKAALKDVGVVIHLNHAGLRCPLPAAVDTRFRVLHANGIHEIALSFCGCGREVPRYLQLLRRGLYPATQQNIRTCATFPLLHLLHTLSLTAKTSAYDFYRALENMTPGYEISRAKSRYRTLMRMLTQWRHLKMLKRAGRGHDVSGAAGTSNGELSLRCPSCPHPDINLPQDWYDAPPAMQFLYAIFLCMDANFRLKNNLVSNYSSDPGLGVGMAYLLPRGPYEDYVLSQADEADISTCVGFQALAKATTRSTKGLRYTGVAAIVCGRSEMVLPNAVGNLQKGERYANVDYVFASAIRYTHLLIIAISYDIVCQWMINLFRRMRFWPSDVKLRPGMHIRPFIPKFHAPAHKEEDHEQYSLNLAQGAGMTDGEAIERVWAPHNGLANSTKTAGPGTRQDILDDNFAFWNFHKYTMMGATLMRRYKAAVSDRNKQVEAHRGFTNSLPEDVAAEWEDMCVQWDADGFPKTVLNPYKVAGADVTEDEVKKEMQKTEEEAQKASGEPARHETSAVSFIWLGLELEELQRYVKSLAGIIVTEPTQENKNALEQQRSLLREKLEGFLHVRAVYMPGLLQYSIDVGSNIAATWDSDPLPDDVALWLPSSIPASHRRMVCSEGLPEIELKLRTAQCSSSLASLRQVLRLKTRMIYYKLKNIRGQREGVRSRAVINRVHRRAIRFVLKYRAARRAKIELEGPGDWELEFQELKNEDVRSYASGVKKKGPGARGIWEDGHAPPAVEDDADMSSDEEDASDIEMGDVARQTDAQLLKKRKKGTGETRKAISWIWQSTRITIDRNDKKADLILRAEWAISRARAARAREEVQLLREEMRRVLAYLEWSADVWFKRLKGRPSVDPTLLEGVHSYAHKQASLQRRLGASFRLIWKTPLEEVPATDTSQPTATAGTEAQFFANDPVEGSQPDTAELNANIEDDDDDNDDNDDGDDGDDDGDDDDGDGDDDGGGGNVNEASGKGKARSNNKGISRRLF